jgi:hypothetical protein
VLPGWRNGPEYEAAIARLLVVLPGWRNGPEYEAAIARLLVVLPGRRNGPEYEAAIARLLVVLPGNRQPLGPFGLAGGMRHCPRSYRSIRRSEHGFL